jgi:hypothetical protein
MKSIRSGPRIDLQVVKDLSNVENLQSHGEIEAKEESWQEKDKLGSFSSASE